MSFPLKRRPSEDDENGASQFKYQRTNDSPNLNYVSEGRTVLENDPSCSVEGTCDEKSASQNVIDSKVHFIQLKESDVGIIEYINDLPSLSAVVKHRYSDFLVNEIDLNGRIVQLTSLDEPEDPGPDIDHNALSANELNLIDDLQKQSNRDAKVTIDVTSKSKEERTKVHQLIRKMFPELDSTTTSNGEMKHITVQKNAGKRRRASRPSQYGKYAHFVLYKENRDTMDAINTIASNLRVSPKHFSYAGTKDKRGKTVQRVAAYQITASQLLSLNFKWKQMKIGNVEYKNTPLKLGDLQGNRFIVILRQFEGDVDTLKEAVSSLSSQGFINYYGMQRFGTTSIATHRIGRAILLQRWKEAVDLILQPRNDGADKHVEDARKTWFETRNAKQALEKLHYKSSIEGMVLSGLVGQENNYLQGLGFLPRNIRLMYIHSYQSYIWNKVLSRKIKEFGLKPQVGDFILPGPLSACDAEDEVTSSSVQQSELKAEPEILTEDKLNEKSIYDVVLPLPGHLIKYPDNITKRWYEEFLKEDDMDFSLFKSNQKGYSLTGAYRKIVVKPTEVKWELLPYHESMMQLVLSDWEALNGEQLPHLPKTDEVNGDEMKTAVKLEMVLPASSYATMAIREVLKLQKNLHC